MTKIAWLCFVIFVACAFVGAAMAIYGSYHTEAAWMMNWGAVVALLTIPALAGYLWTVRHD